MQFGISMQDYNDQSMNIHSMFEVYTHTFTLLANFMIQQSSSN